MRIIKIFVFTLLVTWLIFFVQACQQPGGNTSGSEYMPDMAHSIAYEANYYEYYYNNTWNGKDEYHHYAIPRTPVKGTIPRGYAGRYYAEGSRHSDESDDIQQNSFSTNAITHIPAGSVPYPYGNTEEERTRATAEIIENPFPITDKGLATGKELFTIYCAICHGDKGDGTGYLVREASPGDEGGKYPVQPANFLLPEFVSSSNGRYYHSIMYGKNMMGSYADKLNYEERWQVIHYIRSLQAKELKLTYNQNENTLNTVDVPAGDLISENQETDNANPASGSLQTDEEMPQQSGHQDEH